MWWVTLALAAEPEEIIVYADKFARWDHTRWLVQSELLLPLGVQLALDTNQAFTSHLFQVHAVLACDLAPHAGRKRADVDCVLEDIALQATSLRDFSTEAQRARTAAVLDGIDAQLTGATVQLQVDVSGGVNNFDLEGLTADNLRERERNETLRQVVARTISAFHLRVPDQVKEGVQWGEPHSALMDLPSLVGSRGSSQIVHQLSMEGGHPVLQSAGKGMAIVSLPRQTTQLFKPRPAAFSPTPETARAPLQLATESMGPKAPPVSFPAPELNLQLELFEQSPNGNVSLVECSYALQLSSVGVFADGVLKERVWAVVGEPTASTGGPPYLNVGRLRQLGQNERPDLGPSRQVAWPGRAMEGLAPWVDLL